MDLRFPRSVPQSFRLSYTAAEWPLAKNMLTSCESAREQSPVFRDLHTYRHDVGSACAEIPRMYAEKRRLAGDSDLKEQILHTGVDVIQVWFVRRSAPPVLRI